MLTIMLAGFGVVSCDNDELTNSSVQIKGDGAATVGAVDPYLNVTGVSTYNEGGVDTDVVYSIELANPLPVKSYVTVTVVPGGTAVEDEDFSYQHEIEIPAWSKSVKSKVTILGDAVNESAETFSLNFKSTSDDGNIVVKETTLAFNITDFGDLNLEFNWDRTIPGFEPLTLCDVGYDVDMYVFDAAGNDVTNFTGATSNCPEAITLSLQNLKDGVYQIKQNVYSDVGLASAGITPAFKVPVTVNYTRDNSPFAGSFVQDNSDAVDSDFGNVSGFNTQMIYVGTIKIENGLFTFSKNGNTLATGRMSSNFTLPNNKVRRNYF